LDPLGYDIKQLDVLFLILGTMIVRLGSEPGEFQLKLLFSFMRLCVEAAKDFRWIDHIRRVVTTFIESPAGRTKDQLPNLLVLVGYLLVVPSHELGLDNDRVWKSFWSAFLGTVTLSFSFRVSFLKRKHNHVLPLFILFFHIAFI
jgi:hypothetical protein